MSGFNYTVLLLSLFGSFISGVSLWWAQHSADPIDKRFWIGFLIAGFTPVGSYLVGKFQVSFGQPFDKEIE